MGTVQLVSTAEGAVRLAALLNGSSRRKPTAVVTVPAGRPEPWIDAGAIADQAGNLADVFLLPTGALTWEFSRMMAEGTQVYGGAGRVYPVGHEWTTDLARSPLRFAFNAADGQVATTDLIADALRMAVATGLLNTVAKHELRKVSGVVKWVMAGRAVVDIGGGTIATVAEELTISGVPIERLVTAGQRVDGTYDAGSRRLDVTGSLLAAADALAHYRVGDVVLARVELVRSGKAELLLYPRTGAPAVVVAVLREDVTSNPADDLRTLMSVGEVIPTRVTSAGHPWSLSLLDVDDDEPIVAAPALLPGGPSWLIEEQFGDIAPEQVAPAQEALPAPVPPPIPRPQAPAPSRPTPGLLARPRPTSAPAASTTPSAPPPSESTKGLLLKIAGLDAKVAQLERETATLTAELAAGQGERTQLQALADERERRIRTLELDVRKSRASLRKAKAKVRPSAGAALPSFADPEEGFRFLVQARWADRVPVSEQKDRPLGPYTLGVRFLDTVRLLEGISSEKVADVVVEIMTGLAPSIAGREVHQLRTGSGGGDPVRTRSDGAVAWRASLQVNTPSARRIHYWRLPDHVELACVATHDSFEI